jgi:hypothetical protein
MAGMKQSESMKKDLDSIVTSLEGNPNHFETKRLIEADRTVVTEAIATAKNLVTIRSCLAIIVRCMEGPSQTTYDAAKTVHDQVKSISWIPKVLKIKLLFFSNKAHARKTAEKEPRTSM